MRLSLTILTITACLALWVFNPGALPAQTQNAWQTFQFLDQLILDDPAAALTAIQSERNKVSLESDPDAWLTLTLLAAEAASSTEQNRLSRELAEAALKAAEQRGDKKAKARSWLLLGSWFEVQDQTQDAEKYFNLARESLSGIDDPHERANILNRVAYFYNRQALWQQAIRLLTEAFALLESGPRNALYYDLRNNLGSVYARGDLRREQEGVSWMKESLLYFQTKKQRFMAASILLNLAQHYGDQSQNQEALAAYGEGLGLVKDLKDQSIRAYLLAARGVQYLQDGSNDQGLRELKAAQDIFSQGDNQFMVGRIGIYLSDGLLQIKKTQEALQELEKAALSFAGSQALYDKFLIQKRRIKLFRIMGLKAQELDAYRVWEPLYAEFLAKQDNDQAHRMSAEFDLERKDQLNRLLEVQNQNQALALAQVQKERFYMLLGLVGGAGLIIVMTWGLWQGKQAKQQRQNLQEVLDSVHEGILRIGTDKKIFGRYSIHLAQILERSDPLRGHDILALLFPDKNEGQVMTAAVLDAILGEDISAWEFNHSHLPEEISYRDKVLQLFWRPRVDMHQKVSHLVLVIRDISEQKAYELSLKREQEKQEGRNRKALELRQSDFLRVERYLQRLESSSIVLDSLRITAERDRSAMRQLHTWKGEARTLGLNSLAQLLHEMEESILAQSQADDTASLRFQQLIPKFWEAHREYQSITREYGEISQTHQGHGLTSVVSELLPDLQTRLKTAGIAWQGIQIRDEQLEWTPDQIDLTRTLLLHALSNSVDHGFLRAPASFQTTAAAFFEVSALVEHAGMRLIVRDNGQGILWEKLQEMAAGQGLPEQDRAALTRLLFADGVSTASAASLSSGRGVGLAAIQELCIHHKGRVDLLDHPNQRGASLEAWIPLPLSGNQ